MAQKRSLLFKFIDNYSRLNYKCFLAEFDETETEYICCFRPTSVEKGSANQWACKYLRINKENALGTNQALTPELIDQLNEEMTSFTQSLM